MRSAVLVGIQFSSIAAIVLLGTVPNTGIPLLVFLGGMLLGAGSIITMRFDNLRIFPEPKKDIRLVTSGPYKYIRHPMYTSVLMMTIAFILPSPTILLFLFWIILGAALLGKITIEERLLPQVLADYADYQKRTWKLLPYVF